MVVDHGRRADPLLDKKRHEVADRLLRGRDPRGGTFRCPGYPFVPLVYLLTCLGVAVSSTLYDWRRALWGVLLVAAGFPLYALARRFISPGGR